MVARTVTGRARVARRSSEFLRASEFLGFLGGDYSEEPEEPRNSEEPRPYRRNLLSVDRTSGTRNAKATAK